MLRPSGALPGGREGAKVFVCLVYSILLAIWCDLIIEFLQTGGDGRRLFGFTVMDATTVTLLNSAMIWVVVVLLWSLVGRMSVTTFLSLAAAVAVGYANYLKLHLRHEPLYPSDLDFLSSPGFLMQMAGIKTLALVCTLLAILGVVVALVSRILSRSVVRIQRSSHPRLWWSGIATRAIAAVLAVSFLAYAASFNTPDNKLRRVYEAGGAHWAFWYQKLNYTNNGFVAGLLYNTHVPAMVRPSGYSKAAMERIVERYSTRAQELSAAGAHGTEQSPNIVLALSEAFSDPTRLSGVHYSEDPIPFTRRLMTRTTSGTMLAQLFGGGTANMEFEALTGLSLSQFEPQMNTPYQMLLPSLAEFPSIVGYLKAHGYRAEAVHPYMKSMYKRESAYRALGFDRFLGEDDMHRTEELEKSIFISDDSAFRETERRIASSDAPLLVNLVTMQNHVSMRGFYRKPIPVQGVPKNRREEAGDYGRGLRYTDEALKGFLGRLRATNEKTVVVFYGDHLPAIWPDSTYERNGVVRMRETPYFQWANFDVPKSKTPSLTSPIYFLPQLFRSLGVEIPPFYALLLDLQSEVPAMEQGEYFDSSGRPVPFDQLSPRAKLLLHDYRMVQYDLSIGGRYSQDQLFYPQASSVSRASE